MSNNRIDSNLSSWIFLPKDSDFPIQNIPFGIFQTDTQKARICTRIGDTVIDLYAVAEQGFFNNIIDDIEVFSKSALNLFISLGKKITNLVRLRVIELFSISNIELQSRDTSKFLYAVNQVQLLLPVEIGDYTDFYSSKEHATNVGIMFRDPENALLPNWLHLPVGYHGRASSIVVSGTNFFRPKGQMKPKADEPPVYGPSKSLDF